MSNYLYIRISFNEEQDCQDVIRQLIDKIDWINGTDDDGIWYSKKWFEVNLPSRWTFEILNLVIHYCQKEKIPITGCYHFELIRALNFFIDEEGNYSQESIYPLLWINPNNGQVFYTKSMEKFQELEFLDDTFCWYIFPDEDNVFTYKVMMFNLNGYTEYIPTMLPKGETIQSYFQKHITDGTFGNLYTPNQEGEYTINFKTNCLEYIVTLNGNDSNEKIYYYTTVKTTHNIDVLDGVVSDTVTESSIIRPPSRVCELDLNSVTVRTPLEDDGWFQEPIPPQYVID